MKQTIIIAFLLIVTACQGPSIPQKPAQSTTAVQQTPAASPVDGVYVFDSYRYKEEQLKHPDNVFKDVAPENVDQAIKVFAPFQIKIDRGWATASFSNEVIRGQIKTLSQTPQETRLQMTPISEEKKNDLLTLIITGNSLVMDPGKEEKDKMFYKKAEGTH